MSPANANVENGVLTDTLFDGFGRPQKTQSYEDASHYIETTTTYDAFGHVATTTNPSRPGDGLAYPTTNTYDTLGRPVAVTVQDGSSLTTIYSGPTTTVTDQAEVSRKNTYDALGRLVRVQEDPNGANIQTAYQYDALNNLVGVNQAGQLRSFVYDSLSRLQQASNPESGTIRYAYDAVGNLQTKTDGRNVTTTYSYDALNRLITKSYSDGTSAVHYQFDRRPDGSSLAYALGRLVQVSNGASVTNITGYDPIGEITGSQQITGGQAFNFSYDYNFSGALISETYPSGRVVTSGYDGANRPAYVGGSWAGATTNYVGNPNDPNFWTSYWPHGGIHFYPQANGIFHASSFNPRLQQTESYDMLFNDPSHTFFVSCPNWGSSENPGVYDLCPHPARTPNNGNLVGYDEYHGGPGYPRFLTFHQSFTYDRLNRLGSVADSGGWSRTFNYDAFGNMWASNVTGIATGAPASGSVYGANNRLVSASYDAAGNLLVVNANTLTYDAENRQTTVTVPPAFAGGTEQYAYDGEGRRVAKSGPSGATVYVYDAAGQLAAEYPTVAASSPCATCYLSTDHLGTTRLITDQNGNVMSRHDFAPFGEEILAGQGGRDAHFGPYNDTVNQQFTGKERDFESGLDYFGARYYVSSMGRWMSPDWSANPEAVPYSKLDNPQSLNLYQYVLNNPLSQKDDDGHEIIYASGLKNMQLVQDSVTAILANPNTSGYLSGYVGPNVPNLTIQSGDLGPPIVTTLPNGQTLTTTVQGNTAPDIQTSTMTDNNGVKTSETTLTGATITINNNTSKGDTPGVMIHESVHAGEAQKNPAQFVKDAKGERGQPHDSRPQEQRANAVRGANEKQIKQQIKQIERDRKKEQE